MKLTLSFAGYGKLIEDDQLRGADTGYGVKAMFEFGNIDKLTCDRRMVYKLQRVIREIVFN